MAATASSSSELPTPASATPASPVPARAQVHPPQPRLPEQFRAADDSDFRVSELVSDAAGAHSPFGDTEFPMPLDKLIYTHPGPENRPRLADGH